MLLFKFNQKNKKKFFFCEIQNESEIEAAKQAGALHAGYTEIIKQVIYE